MKTRNLETAGEHFRRGRQEAEKMLAAEPSSINECRTVANFSEKLGDYHALLATAKGTPPAQQQSHKEEANALYRRAAELFSGLKTRRKLTIEDQKSLEQLNKKLSISATPPTAAATRPSPH